MKRRSTRHGTHALALASALAVTLWASMATAQNNPTQLGGGNKAYVLMIIDSSASMEYTTVDDNQFPTTNTSSPGGPPLGHPDFNAESEVAWVPGIAIDADATRGLGSCWVYHPSTDCTAYGRPSWRPQPDPGWPIATPPASWRASTPLYDPEISMRGDYTAQQTCATGGACSSAQGWRMQDVTQPRHVTIKEILSGNMIMLPTDASTYSYSPSFYDADFFGPGCWFIPRQRDASTQPVEDQTYCSGIPEFENIPDFDQPVPHFQEVYDVQQATGVLDTLATTAIFSVAAFDGYREDITWGGFNTALNDQMRGSSPGDDNSIRAGTVEGDPDCDADGDANDPCYNLGVWQVIGPSNLDIPSSLLPELAAYTQIAINDTGFLRDDSSDDYTLFVDSTKSKANAYLGATFSSAMSGYARDVTLGKQPIARATPIAAAIHDVYQFMAYGQDDPAGNAEDPINTDTFTECRPKHVVLLTDGQPSPERDPDIAGNPTGQSDTLNEAFGYVPTRYKYDTAEQEIRLLATDARGIVAPNSADPAVLNKYDPRVHVLGLNIGSGDNDAIRKMARMAVSGNSCASALVPELVPDTHSYDDGTGTGTMVLGTCVPGTGCLVEQTAAINEITGGSDYDWMHPADEVEYKCNDFAALILDKNDPDVIAGALSSFMSALVGASGLSSRTRVVVSNRLDNTSLGQGGQYRVYSGVRVGGGSAWWKGVLNRTTRLCGGGPTSEVSLDQQIGTLVETIGTPSDRRRVWTAVPSQSIWDFATGGVPVSPTPAITTNYPFAYDLQQVTSGDDEFKATYLTNVAAGENIVLGTRVPFEHSFIKDAFPVGIDPYDDYNVFDDIDFIDMVNVFRARIKERVSDTRGGNLPDLNGVVQDRVLGGILNSNPVIVGPPELDLPIASYRDFRARYADRTSMLYVSSMDGLLHAIHMGKLQGLINFRSPQQPDAPRGADVFSALDAANQREAWAYMPWMLHRDLSSFTNYQAYLMDGTPVAKDVRLCQQLAVRNTNSQACRAVCTGGCTQLEGADQWRTVLVQGRGQAGAGYYAMDITRPGGIQYNVAGTSELKNPDPVLLWEFDREWEAAQLAYFYDTPGSQKARVSSEGSAAIPDPTFYQTTECSNDVDNLWLSPLLGSSVSEPEIATVIVDGEQRPVAVFGGGSNDINNSGCGASASGMAIYVVDLQTGSIIRRFTHYDGSESFLKNTRGARFVGSPTLYDSSTGAIASRGFIGDNQGRLFRIDFLKPDPLDWTVSLFFDPEAHPDLPAVPQWGPAAFKPAVALNAQRQVMVVYGLGENGDVVTNGQTQAVLTLTEEALTPETGKLAWAQVLDVGEKITGAPVIFNRDVYFPTYAVPAGDVCEPGNARIWGLRLVDSDPGVINDVIGIFGSNPTLTPTPPAGIVVDAAPDYKWYGPIEPTLVRGLTITLGELCSTTDIGTDSQSFSANDKPQPQLIAQTSGPVPTGLTNTDAAATPVAANALDRVVLDIEPPASQTIPLSWSLVY